MVEQDSRASDNTVQQLSLKSKKHCQHGIECVEMRRRGNGQEIGQGFKVCLAVSEVSTNLVMSLLGVGSGFSGLTGSVVTG